MPDIRVSSAHNTRGYREVGLGYWSPRESCWIDMFLLSAHPVLTPSIWLLELSFWLYRRGWNLATLPETRVAGNPRLKRRRDTLPGSSFHLIAFYLAFFLAMSPPLGSHKNRRPIPQNQERALSSMYVDAFVALPGADRIRTLVWVAKPTSTRYKP